MASSGRARWEGGCVGRGAGRRLDPTPYRYSTSTESPLSDLASSVAGSPFTHPKYYLTEPSPRPCPAGSSPPRSTTSATPPRSAGAARPRMRTSSRSTRRSTSPRPRPARARRRVASAMSRAGRPEGQPNGPSRRLSVGAEGAWREPCGGEQKGEVRSTRRKLTNYKRKQARSTTNR